MFKVDVFIPRPRPFLQSQLARAQKWVFAFETEVSAKFASPENTILSKLEWYRMGGEVSERVVIPWTMLVNGKPAPGKPNPNSTAKPGPPCTVIAPANPASTAQSSLPCVP